VLRVWVPAFAGMTIKSERKKQSLLRTVDRCHPWRGARASDRPDRPSVAGRSAGRAAVPLRAVFDTALLPSLARRQGFGSPCPTLRGRS